jgi:4-amino-4-deoxy-L-arabinose transferase-like glycosyltransferase
MLKNKINLFNTLNGRILFLIILSTITLQIIYFITFQNKYGELGYTTESYYQDTAINLITFKSYSQGDPPVNTAYRPPLYPFTLAGVYTIFGKYPQLAIILNNLFIIISLFTTYLIGKKISPSIGLISAILFALDPVIFVNANRISAGSQYCMLISLFVFITINNFDRNITLKNSILSSLILGLATFTRALTLYISIPISIGIFIVQKYLIKNLNVKKTIYCILIFILIQILIIGSWMVRNYQQTDNFTYASMTSTHLGGYFIPLIISEKKNISYEEAQKEFKDIIEKDNYSNVSDNKKHNIVTSRSIEIIQDNPINTIKVMLKQSPVVFLNYPQTSASIFLNDEKTLKLNTFLVDYHLSKSSKMDVTGYINYIKHYAENNLIFPLIHAIVFKSYLILMMLIGITGSILLLINKTHRPKAIFLTIMMIYIIVICSTWPTARLRLTLLPINSVFAAFALTYIYNYLKKIIHKEN